MSDTKDSALSVCDIRDAHEGDKNFILATFLRGLYYGDTWFSQIPKDIFMNNYKFVAERLITSPNTIIKIACLKEDLNVIVGYSILSSDYQTVHWAYVKRVWRNKGIGKALVPQFPVTVTHLSKLGQSLITKYPTAVFNPFKI